MKRLGEGEWKVCTACQNRSHLCEFGDICFRICECKDRRCYHCAAICPKGNPGCDDRCGGRPREEVHHDGGDAYEPCCSRSESSGEWIQEYEELRKKRAAEEDVAASDVEVEVTASDVEVEVAASDKEDEVPLICPEGIHDDDDWCEGRPQGKTSTVFTPEEPEDWTVDAADAAAKEVLAGADGKVPEIPHEVQDVTDRPRDPRPQLRRSHRMRVPLELKTVNYN